MEALEMFLGEQQTCMVGARAHTIWVDPNQPSHDPIMGGRGCQAGPRNPAPLGSPVKNEKNDPGRQLLCPPCLIPEEKNRSYILEGHLFTNLILSALHLEGLEFYIYARFPFGNKQLIGISFPKGIINGMDFKVQEAKNM
jgi:hypothetical protein